MLLGVSFMPYLPAAYVMLQSPEESLQQWNIPFMALLVLLALSLVNLWYYFRYRPKAVIVPIFVTSVYVIALIFAITGHSSLVSEVGTLFVFIPFLPFIRDTSSLPRGVVFGAFAYLAVVFLKLSQYAFENHEFDVTAKIVLGTLATIPAILYNLGDIITFGAVSAVLTYFIARTVVEDLGIVSADA